MASLYLNRAQHSAIAVGRMSVPDTIESWPPLSTGAIAIAPDGTTYVYQPNVSGGLVPAMATPPDDIEGYPAFSTNGIGVDADGSFWLAYPLSPDGIVDLSPAVPPPENTVAPIIQIISGNPIPGQIAVNSNAGTWVPPQTGGFQRQWYLTGAAIAGATMLQYTIQEDDVGGGLQCGVIAIGDGGPSLIAMSNTLTIVAAPDGEDTRAQRVQQPQAKSHRAPPKHGKTHHAGGLHRRSSGSSKR